MIDFFNTWSQLLNFTFTVHDCLTIPGCYEGEGEGNAMAARVNGSWTGILGYVNRSLADGGSVLYYRYDPSPPISLSLFTHCVPCVLRNSQFAEAIDYMYPYGQTNWLLLLPDQDEVPLSRRVSLQGFVQTDFILITVASYLLVLLLFAIAYRFLAPSNGKHTTEGLLRRLAALDALLMFLMRKFIAQCKYSIVSEDV